ncbi:MAG: hypothetical protein MSIBF_04685 [Candidatus Altiarchaeales archaeon IMC4]|nr:MAG: hypothetical protein MSIBF_04685 [Candidatus Altiarchaeales archaeon IMC4]
MTKASFEPMATAARYMKKMNTNLGGKIDNVAMDVRNGFVKTDDDFSRMDTKYDKIMQTVSLQDTVCDSSQTRVYDKMDSIGHTLQQLTKAILKLVESKS